jgi:glucose-1-phosphate cytidylyltransferase
VKAVILAGGLGTRISEETHLRPKPMIEVGGKPILWHIMKMFAAHGVDDFVVCCGYKGYVIKEYFANYFLHTSDVTFDLKNNQVEVHHNSAEPWRVTLVDTGEQTMTGGRLRRVRDHVEGERFFFTYGDAVSDVDLHDVLRVHTDRQATVTLTAIQPTGRFGAVELAGDGVVTSFQEKPKGDGGWVNGGFFVVEPEAIDHIAGDDTIWEREPLECMTAEGGVAAYRHRGFWHPMDTLRDKNRLEELWAAGQAPWRTW